MDLFPILSYQSPNILPAFYSQADPSRVATKRIMKLFYVHNMTIQSTIFSDINRTLNQHGIRRQAYIDYAFISALYKAQNQ